MQKIVASLAAVAAAASMSACSFSFTTAKVKGAEVQTRIATDYRAQKGVDAVVSCPGDLEGKKGATMTCQAAIGGRTYPAVVSVTDVQGGKVAYTWRVDDPQASATNPSTKPTSTRPTTTQPTSTRPTSTASAPTSVPASKVEEWVKEDVTKKNPKYATAVVDCEGDLHTYTGATQECRVTHESGTLLLTLTVTGVEGSMVRYSMKEH